MTTTTPTTPPTPATTVPVTITYLEMKSPGQLRAAPTRPAEPVSIVRADRPTVSFYRYLYGAVGADWNWYERRLLADEALAAILHDDRVEVFVLHVRGTPAGYAELDRRVEGEVEVAYFGLIREYVGRGFGSWFLHRTLARAWSYRPRRVWLDTCSLDHPRALSVYERAGLEAYRRKEVQVDAALLLEAPRPAPHGGSGGGNMDGGGDRTEGGGAGGGGGGGRRS